VTQGLVFVLETLVEMATAMALAWPFAARIARSRADSILRCGAAALIGTGITLPAFWLWKSRLIEMTGSWWGGMAAALCLMILVEAPVYAAALRGQWRVAAGLSVLANLAGFGAGLLLMRFLARAG